jgi:hypothetical protein
LTEEEVAGYYVELEPSLTLFAGSAIGGGHSGSAATRSIV